MRTPQDPGRRLPRASRRTRLAAVAAIGVLVVLIASLRGLAGFWTDYLWFDSVGFTSVFRGVLLTKIVLALVFIVLFFALMMVNLAVADRLAPLDLDPADANELVVRFRDFVFSRSLLVRTVTSLVFALFAGTGASSQWNNWDLFHYRVNFGVRDPQFHRDVGFYVFQLPFIQFLVNWAFDAVVVVLIVTAVLHYLNGGILPQAAQRRVSSGVKAHLSVLFGALAVIKAVSYYYDRLALDLSRSHVVNGATATSVHANAPADVLLMVIAVVSALLFLANIRQRGWILPAVAVALWGLVSLLVGEAYPALYQALRVSPSELTREAPYIQRNIDATRRAYGLDKVKVVNNYQYSSTLTAPEVQGTTPQAAVNQQVISNVRLLDPAVNILNTFDRYQALRSYYSFNQLNLDRYDLPAGTGTQETATVASVRELNNSVPSGFVNQHLEYTHGYGAVLSPISQAGVNADGTPNFVMSGLPPESRTPNVMTSPQGSQVYFGLGPDTNGYVIANSKTPELDYQNVRTDQEVQTHYSGRGGVSAGSLLRRAAFALRFGDANFVLSGQINSDSKVMFIRDVAQRAHKAAPFLKLDSDPYAVLVDGQIFWVIDAYTISDNYPYSQNANLDSAVDSGLFTTFNYVRNSVKIVVSAYDGSMRFYDMGTGDPILRVYERAFPDLFTPVAKAPAALVAHFRYPENIFQIQTNMFGRYHLTSAADFYSQAQAWAVSPDPGSGELSSNSQVGASVLAPNGQPLPASVPRLQPQYELLSLPNQPRQGVDFVLLSPFVPISNSGSSQNLTAFMTASSDPGTYGDLTMYPMPPGQTVQGPGLVASAIRANPQISAELTFYNQQGSLVELGEVAIVPLDQTLLYIQPVYVESSSNRIPTLDDVVVVYDGHAYHSSNASVDNALCQINDNGTNPFAQYCNTAAAQKQQLVSPNAGLGGAAGGSPSSTTTTVPGSGPAPAPAGGSVSALLAQADSDLQQAQAALRAGNLASYQQLVNAAQAAVQQADQQASGGGGGGKATTTTTAPGGR